MIRVEQLYHSYTGDTDYAVAGLDFQVAKGEIFGFLGPNGAGKSTTQKILTGTLPLQKGRAEVAGIDVRRPGPDFYQLIGVSFERPNLYHKLTGLENLVFFRGMYAGDLEDPQHLLRLFGLEEAAHKRVGHYSKGMKQRLMLARSLLNKPRIWFLDEPTSGLDPASARDVKDIIRAKRDAGVTVFLTTHDMHVADELCDRVAFINEGRIALIDTPRNLKLRFGEKLVRVEHRTAGGQVARENLSLEREADRRRLHELIESQTVETMHSQEATLEDIFIQVTGRGLS